MRAEAYRMPDVDVGAFITTDQNLPHQQNLAGRRIAILVLLTTDWRLIRQRSDRVLAAIARVAPGSCGEVAFAPADS